MVGVGEIATIDKEIAVATKALVKGVVIPVLKRLVLDGAESIHHGGVFLNKRSYKLVALTGNILFIVRLIERTLAFTNELCRLRVRLFHVP